MYTTENLYTYNILFAKGVPIYTSIYILVFHLPHKRASETYTQFIKFRGWNYNVSFETNQTFLPTRINLNEFIPTYYNVLYQLKVGTMNKYVYSTDVNVQCIIKLTKIYHNILTSYITVYNIIFYN